MLQAEDLKTLREKGIAESQVAAQLEAFRTGFPFLKIARAAEAGHGIVRVTPDEAGNYHARWDEYLQGNPAVVKFVPASGAASRMFKDLFEFLDGTDDEPVKPFMQKFFADIHRFAFYPALDEACLRNEGEGIDRLIARKQYKAVVANLLLERGLNYGALPKGLLLFHSYADEKRTPVKEHLVEAALYATNRAGQAHVHFTVSKEHRTLFEQHIAGFLTDYEARYGVKYAVDFSEQKPSTDTIAADKDNRPFRDEAGRLVFRPGGHGALIENLNDLDADVIFVKNIDNVVPDSLKDETVTYKKLIAGMLVSLQRQTFAYLHELEHADIAPERLAEIADFCDTQLNNHNPEASRLAPEDLRRYLQGKLNRPMRVCGMVKNEGEPGGGPFLIVNKDGCVSPQILESSQIDTSNPTDKTIMQQSTHFNPVDLVCATKDYKGAKFDLLRYVDREAGFISSKSKNGKELKALELPGLWNGAMSDWNTIFVEVPVATFNPVKTVNDLLRTEHQ